MVQVQPLIQEWHQLLGRRISAPAVQWLTERGQAIGAGDQRAAATAVALVPRWVGKADLAPTADELSALDALCPGLDVRRWSVDQVARSLLLCHLPATDGPTLVAALDALFRCADVAEAAAMYQALPCLPHGPSLVARAREGLRSNQKPLCAAVALTNPFAHRHFDQDAWNQMVLKCLFVGLPLHEIQGLDARHNRALSMMLSDYARERRAAARPIPWDLWRAAVPHLPPERLADVRHTLNGVAGDDPRARPAAALALAANCEPAAAALLQDFPQLAQAVRSGTLTWDRLHTQAAAFAENDLEML